MYKKTKIVATISDMRCDVDFIKKLFDEGMNVVRLNTAHQGAEGMKKVIDNVRSVSDRIAILVDTKGPEVRTTICSEPIPFVKGETVKIVGKPDMQTTHDVIAVNCTHFVNDVTLGAHILIDDGDLGMIVVEKHDDELVCLIENNATLGSRKSVNVPGVRINLPAISEKDKINIQFAIDNDIEFIAHSFVRSKEDVYEVRSLLQKAGSDIQIIAKIENQEGVDNIDEILEAADGVMVARGDLGIEVAQELIPGIQRKIVNKAIFKRKPVIVATQMLQSMIKNPRPTRTELTDIANAVYSRTDAVMLSGETAYGDYPVEAVRVMAKVARQAEQDICNDKTYEFDIPLSSCPNSTEFFAKEAVTATETMDLRAILTDSYTGMTARYVSSFRGWNPILALCYRPKTMRRLSLVYGVYAIYMPTKTFGHDLLLMALKKLLEDNILTPEDKICYLGSQRKEQKTSFMEMNSVESYLSEEFSCELVK